MGWIDALRGTVVGLDTAPLIYLIEEHPVYLPGVRPFFEAAHRREFRIVTSILSLTEVLVHPMRLGDHALVSQYRRILLQADQITVVPVSEIVAEEAAQLRARHSLRTPDAIHLATALRSGASSFLTNDRQMPKLPGLNLLVLDQLMST
jgi:predicted nucleic acid-binding protein